MQALEGIRILDFTRHLSRPFATLQMGDFGTDVIKIVSVPHRRSTRLAAADPIKSIKAQADRMRDSLAVCCPRQFQPNVIYQ